MNNIETQYLNLLRTILTEGETNTDERTGVGTRSVFGHQLRARLSDGFPMLTTKRVPWKPVLSELLWFIEGSGDERRLAEILHRSRDPELKTIWTANAEAPYWKDKAKFPGDLGRVYGVQWRSWQTGHNEPRVDKDGHTWHLPKEIDQLSGLIQMIKKDPASRRQIVTAWNPGELDQMALPPCHMFFQTRVSKSRDALDLQVYIRSNDMFLGAPFNIASYAMLTHLLATHCFLQPGELIVTIGDAHIYLNHVDQVEAQLSRAQRPFPTLIDKRADEQTDMFLAGMSDFELEGYDPHPPISAPMAV